MVLWAKDTRAEDGLARREKDVAKVHAWLAEQRSLIYSERGAQAQAEPPSIPEVFSGESIFLTGGSGFLGKVLIEKLLRSCPAIERIYVLLRPKKDVLPEDRMTDLFTQQLFQPLLEKFPDAPSKVTVINGDCSELGLGLSDQDRVTLQRDVAFVFHVAASVHFDDPLKKAVLLNVRGTREIVELAKGMPKLKAFVHVSTSYCNGENCEERVYQPSMDPDMIIRVAERCDPRMLDGISHKLLSFQPNTYLFTKQIAESVVSRAGEEIPVIITRPSIVTPTVKDPMPGWLDNLNGPMALCLGVGKGVLRYAWVDPKKPFDVVSVDTTIRAIILAAWLRATKQKISNRTKTGVINITNNGLYSINWQDIHIMADELVMKAPMGNALRYPRVTLTRSRVLYKLGVFFSHILFAIFIDTLLKLAGRKPRLLAIYRKLEATADALAPFTVHHTYVAQHNNFWNAMARMKLEDLQDFDVVLHDDERSILIACGRCATMTIFNETYDFDKFKKQIKRLYIVELVSWFVFGVFCIWLVIFFGLPTF